MKFRAKHGYVITTTPGLVEEGVFPLSAAGIRKNEISSACTTPSLRPHDIAVYRTRSAAVQAMRRLVPDGKSPSAYAGLDVAPAYEYTHLTLADPADICCWMD